MIRSMTGYGEAEGGVRSNVLRIEVSSVNGKFLNIHLQIPEPLEPFRAEIERFIRSKVPRGTLRMRVFLPDLEESGYEIDSARLQHYWKTISEAAAVLNDVSPPDIASVAALPGVVKLNVTASLSKEYWEEIAPVLEEALKALLSDREREGASIREKLKEIVSPITAFEEKLVDALPETDAARYEKYRERMEQLAGEHASEEIIVREAAVLAEKHNITEELHRLTTHAEEFLKLLEADSSEGRKLEFITQEMHREANTMCSKSDNAEVSRAAMDIRAGVHQIRELILNVE